MSKDFKPTKSVIYIHQQMTKTGTAFVKLRKYVDESKRLTKHELRELLDNISTPLFNALDDGEDI